MSPGSLSYEKLVRGLRRAYPQIDHWRQVEELAANFDVHPTALIGFARALGLTCPLLPSDGTQQIGIAESFPASFLADVDSIAHRREIALANSDNGELTAHDHDVIEQKKLDWAVFWTAEALTGTAAKAAASAKSVDELRRMANLLNLNLPALDLILRLHGIESTLLAEVREAHATWISQYEPLSLGRKRTYTRAIYPSLVQISPQARSEEERVALAGRYGITDTAGNPSAVALDQLCALSTVDASWNRHEPLIGRLVSAKGRPLRSTFFSPAGGIGRSSIAPPQIIEALRDPVRPDDARDSKPEPLAADDDARYERVVLEVCSLRGYLTQKLHYSCSGEGYYPCPFCHDERNSLQVNEPEAQTGGSFRCHACRAAGDLLDLVGQAHGLVGRKAAAVFLLDLIPTELRDGIVLPGETVIPWWLKELRADAPRTASMLEAALAHCFLPGATPSREEFAEALARLFVAERESDRDIPQMLADYVRSPNAMCHLADGLYAIYRDRWEGTRG